MLLVLVGPLHSLDLDDGLGEEHDGNTNDCDQQNNDLDGVLARTAVITPHRVCF